MAILRVWRVNLHPWCLWTVLRTALWRHTGGSTAETRRVAARANRALKSKFDPDDHKIGDPYALLSTEQLVKMRETNARVGKESPEYSPIPDPDLRVTIDLEDDVRRFLIAAVEAFAKAADIGNEISEAIVDTLDALEGAARVEVDTEKTGAGA